MVAATEIFLMKTYFRNFAFLCQLTNIRHNRQSISEELQMVRQNQYIGNASSKNTFVKKILSS
jgi:hypothetical protein